MMVPFILRFSLWCIAITYLCWADWVLYLSAMTFAGPGLQDTMARLLLPFGCRAMLFSLGFHWMGAREDVDPRRLRLLTKGELWLKIIDAILRYHIGDGVL